MHRAPASELRRKPAQTLRHLRWVCAAGVCALAAHGAGAAAGVSIRLEDGGFVVEALPAGVSEGDFTVYVEGAAEPMLGSASIASGVLRFEPRFRLEPGLRYRAVLRAKPPLESVFAIPRAAAGPAPRVAQVYPSGDELPENLLKLYLHFSAPMSRGEAYQRIHLLDASGRPVDAPFLELQEELWDPSGTRLTLLFDPGRIKRGLVPTEQVGSPLQAGRGYTLVIDPAWPAADGVPLAAEFRKPFTVVAADRAPPEPRRWGIAAPARGTREPLVVVFPEPLDHALLERLLAVLDAAGASIPGSAVAAEQETEWRFTPRDTWRPGRYSLSYGAVLEDRSGNRIGRAFDVDLARGVEPDATPPGDGQLPFEVR